MLVHFNDTRSADAPAETLFRVITDYAAYPTFNDAVVSIEVVRHDAAGAEFLAQRETKVEKDARAFDRYERAPDGGFVVERTYGDGSDARSTWTIHAVDDHTSTITSAQPERDDR